MKLLAFSDLHRDLAGAARLVEMSGEADVVIGAGDFASVHDGLTETIAALGAIEVPTVLVAGNNETAEALREAASGWSAASVLHGEGLSIGGTEFFGLGAGVPQTPWEWSFDLDEGAAARLLAPCPIDAVLVVHSPPKECCDRGGDGSQLGSEAIRATIEQKRPRLVLCGHIHESWGCRGQIGATPVRNLGPSGLLVEI